MCVRDAAALNLSTLLAMMYSRLASNMINCGVLKLGSGGELKSLLKGQRNGMTKKILIVRCTESVAREILVMSYGQSVKIQ